MKKLNLFFVLLSISISGFSLAPTISSFSPGSGPVGTLVTITGTNLSSPTAFSIGDVSAIVVSDNGTTLVGMVMPGAATGAVSVTTSGGTATGSGSFTITATPFPHVQQGSKLVGTGAVNGSIGAFQGFSVALSADGNTAIVGGQADNSNTGAAWVYSRSGTTWTQQGLKLVGTGAVGAADQGIGVALSADGNTAIVAGWGDNSNMGAVWIYTRSGTTWTQQGGKLVGTGAVGAADQGATVSLSADGNTAIVGGFEDNSGAGAAWIYTRSGTTWTQQGGKLVGTGAINSPNGAFQGISVFLSADGNTAIVGGSQDSSYAGAAWVYTRSGTTWTQQGSKLVGTGAINGTPYGAQQGCSVALSADGNTAIVTGNGDNNNAGAAWVYTRTGTTWAQQGSKLVGTGAIRAANQGSSATLSADGNTAIVGGSTDNDSAGAVWVYTRSGTTWTQQGLKLVGSGAIHGSNGVYQGFSASLSADGSTAIEGGYEDNSGAGAAWMFISCSPISSTSSRSICAGDTFVFGSRHLNVPGTYYDTLTSFTGCDSIVTLHLINYPRSIDTVSASICPGSNYTFGGHNLMTAGTYFDTLAGMSVHGCDSIVTLHLTVMTDTVTAHFTLQSSGTPHLWYIVNQCTGIGLSYLWNWGDSTATNTGDTPSHTYAAAGYYHVCVTATDSSGCTASYCDTTVYLFKDQSGQMVYVNVVNHIPNGISEINSQSPIHLYPNPNKGSFTLETSGSIGSDYIISDMLGNVIIQQAIRSDKQVIELPGAAEGVYTLAIKGVSPIRFVIVR